MADMLATDPDPHPEVSLIAGDTPIPHRAIVLAAGIALKRGAVLGEVTATPGTFDLARKAAVDGSQHPALILPFDVPARTGPIPSSGYGMGEFVAEKLQLGDGMTAADVEAYFRANDVPIFIKSVGAPTSSTWSGFA